MSARAAAGQAAPVGSSRTRQFQAWPSRGVALEAPPVLQRLAQPAKAAQYIATHDTSPPEGQTIANEKQSMLLRQFHARNEAKRERAAAAEGTDHPPRKHSRRSDANSAKGPS